MPVARLSWPKVGLWLTGQPTKFSAATSCYAFTVCAVPPKRFKTTGRRFWIQTASHPVRRSSNCTMWRPATAERRYCRNLNLTLYRGEFAAIVGDNGAGKSTLARLLSGVIKPRKGEVRLGNGNRLTDKGDIGLLFQDPLHQLFCETVEEEISFGPRNFGHFDSIKLNPVLEATQLAPLRKFAVHSLSAGQQQRTALAAVLALEPRLVILDEPTMGQDWGHLSRFMDFLNELNKIGTTILLITHDYKLVHRYARRILLLRDGHIAADGSPAGVSVNARGVAKYDSQFVSWSI